MAEQVRRELDAIDLLMQDHREMESLFSEFAYLHEKGEDTNAVIESACAELKIHDAVENDIFYPAVSDAGGEEDLEALLDDAEDAHDRVLDLIEELENLPGDAAARNAHFNVLAEEVRQHILLEEDELFPKLKKLEQLNLDALATSMKTRISELTPKIAVADISAANV